MDGNREEFNYETAGFSQHLTRTIDTLGASGVAASRQFNFDQAQVSGALGDKLRIGSILLDGASGRITIEDDNANVVVLIGELGD